MCMLITGKSNATKSLLLSTAGLMDSLYHHNSDGLGLMYAKPNGTTTKLHVTKRLPKDLTAATQIIQSLPDDDRQVAIHWRMRTHGNIDLDNCHPYMVNGSTFMMHNGVLHTGNKADTTKSDTWHFIKNYLAGLPVDALHDAGFHTLVGDFIESNRFAIMSADGRLSVINRNQGVEKDGVWFSNTYAMDAGILFPEMRKPKFTWTNGGSSYKSSGFNGHFYGSRYDLMDWEQETTFNHTPAAYAALDEEDDLMLDEFEQQVIDAVVTYDVETLSILMEQDPDAAVAAVVTYVPLDEYPLAGKLTPAEKALQELWLNAAENNTAYNSLCRRALAQPMLVAESLIYNCDFKAEDIAA